MKKQLETEIKVGIFVSIGVALTMMGILFLGGGFHAFFSSNIHFTAHFPRIDGLITGAKVILNGVPVGDVDSIELDKKTRNIEVGFTVSKNFGEWIRKNSTVEIATQGVLGDKYLSIEIGSADQDILPPHSDLTIRASADLSQVLGQGDRLMVSLNGIAVSLNRILKSFEADNRNETFFKGIAATANNLSQASEKINREFDQLQLKSAIGNLNHIFEKVNNGTGTVGALINDSALYDNITSLVGGANRNRIIRNLVRQTLKDGKESKPDGKSEGRSEK